MTREEEISTAAFEYIKSDAVKAGEEYISFGDFINGAEWADANPNKDNMATAYKIGEAATIDKACEWLEFVFKELEISGIDDWVESFKYAMKGE